MSLTDVVKKHFVDCTGMLIVTHPIYGSMETFIAGMNPDNLVHSRLLATALTYGGMGFVFSKGRDMSNKLFGITSVTSEKKRQLHDSGYGAAFNLVINPFFYYAAGVRDPKQIALGTLSGIVLGLFTGGSVGYSIDAFGELIGAQQTSRLPEFIQRKSENVKKGLAIAVIVTSLAVVTTLYAASSYLHQQPSSSQVYSSSATR